MPKIVIDLSLCILIIRSSLKSLYIPGFRSIWKSRDDSDSRETTFSFIFASLVIDIATNISSDLWVHIWCILCNQPNWQIDAWKTRWKIWGTISQDVTVSWNQFIPYYNGDFNSHTCTCTRSFEAAGVFSWHEVCEWSLSWKYYHTAGQIQRKFENQIR